MEVKPIWIDGIFQARVILPDGREKICSDQHFDIMDAWLCGWLEYRKNYPMEQPDPPSAFQLSVEEEEELGNGHPIYLLFYYCGGGPEYLSTEDFQTLFEHAKTCFKCAKEMDTWAPGMTLMDSLKRIHNRA